MVVLERPYVRRSALNSTCAEVFMGEVVVVLVAGSASMDAPFFCPSSTLPGHLHVGFATATTGGGGGTSALAILAWPTDRPCDVRHPS
jgi:hypothetical protein